MPDRPEFKKKVWKIIIMANQNEINASKAQLDFICVEPECNGVIKFNLMELAADAIPRPIVCAACTIAPPNLFAAYPPLRVES